MNDIEKLADKYLEYHPSDSRVFFAADFAKSLIVDKMSELKKALKDLYKNQPGNRGYNTGVLDSIAKVDEVITKIEKS